MALSLFFPAFSSVKPDTGLAGEAQAQAAVGAAVHRGEDDGGVGLAPPQGGELIQRPLGQRVGGGGDGQGDQRLIGVEPGVDGAQVVDLHGLDGLDGLPGDEVVFPSSVIFRLWNSTLSHIPLAPMPFLIVILTCPS